MTFTNLSIVCLFVISKLIVLYIINISNGYVHKVHKYKSKKKKKCIYKYI